MAKVFCTGQITTDQLEHVKEQIAKQTLQPTWAIFYIDDDPATGIEARRKRIASNHKKLIELVKENDCDYVIQLEGDGVLPENAFKKLLLDIEKLPEAGYISGIELGRHGVACIGAWHFNKARTEFKSLDYKRTGIVEVDATGFYCLIAKKDVWLKGRASWNSERWGPDVNFGLSLRDKNYKIYCDMDIKISHMVVNKYGKQVIGFADNNICNAEFKLTENNTWVFKQL